MKARCPPGDAQTLNGGARQPGASFKKDGGDIGIFKQRRVDRDAT